MATEILHSDTKADAEAEKRPQRPRGVRLPRWAVKTLTWICRLGVGSVFIFSGFVKGIDPWGTLYKLEDYAAVMGITPLPSLLLTGVFLLCAWEFMLGVFLVTGSFRRATPLLTLLTMGVMLPLTLWIAVSNPVADCGCFGDALKIDNWTTFWKNVALTLITLWLVWRNRSARCLIDPYLQWLGFTVSGLFIVAISLAGYLYQPLIDFRPYPVGGHFAASEEDNLTGSEGESKWFFRYEKDGRTQDFAEDETLPDESEGWTYVDRYEVKSPVHGTSQSDATSEQDAAGTSAQDAAHTQSATSAQDATATQSGKQGVEVPAFMVSPDPLEEGGDAESEDADMATAVPITALGSSPRQIFLLMPSLGEVSAAETWRINSLYDWASRQGIYMAAIVSGSDAEIASWRDISMAQYPIHTADDTAIKQLVRGNPAVVYIHDGVIGWKSTLRAIEADDFMSPDTSPDPMDFSRDNSSILQNMTFIYIIIMGVIIFLSFTPHLGRMMMLRPLKRHSSKRKVTKDGLLRDNDSEEMISKEKY